MKYMILSVDDICEFEMEVNKYLSRGWEPFGGISVLRYERREEGYRGCYRYSQALVLKDKIVEE